MTKCLKFCFTLTLLLISAFFASSKQLEKFQDASEKWGFKEFETGNIVIPAKYDDVDCFIDGYAEVSVNNKRGVIDQNGKIIVPILYDQIINNWININLLEPYEDFYLPEWHQNDKNWIFSDGLVCVELNNKYGYVNTNGDIAIPIQFEDARAFHEGLALVKQTDNYGFIDVKGKFVIKPTFDLAFSFNEGMALVRNRSNGIFGFIDKDWQLMVMKQ